MADRKFDTIVERFMVQRIQYPNKISFSKDLQERFIREYIKIRNTTNSKPETILKALRFLIRDAEDNYKDFVKSLKTSPDNDSK